MWTLVSNFMKISSENVYTLDICSPKNGKLPNICYDGFVTSSAIHWNKNGSDRERDISDIFNYFDWHVYRKCCLFSGPKDFLSRNGSPFHLKCVRTYATYQLKLPIWDFFLSVLKIWLNYIFFYNYHVEYSFIIFSSPGL